MNVELQTKYLKPGTYKLRSPGQYADGSLALEVWSSDHERQLRATVCIQGANVAHGCVLIKDWSENEGILAALQKAGVIEPPERAVSSHFVQAHECRLTEAAMKALRIPA